MHITQDWRARYLFFFTANIFCILDLLSRLPLDHDEAYGAGRGGDSEDQQLPAEANLGGDCEAQADPDTLHQLNQGEGLSAVLGVLAADQRYHLDGISGMEKLSDVLSVFSLGY